MKKTRVSLPRFTAHMPTLEAVKNCCRSVAGHCLKVGKCDCCSSAIIKFLLSGKDGCGSGICGIGYGGVGDC